MTDTDTDENHRYTAAMLSRRSGRLIPATEVAAIEAVVGEIAAAKFSHWLSETIHHNASRKEPIAMTDFPVLDASRLYANNVLDRCVFDSFGDIEPYSEKTDSWVAMPVRVVHDIGKGWHIELGPYSLNGDDIERLRGAIASYDEATNRT